MRSQWKLGAGPGLRQKLPLLKLQNDRVQASGSVALACQFMQALQDISYGSCVCAWSRSKFGLCSLWLASSGLCSA